MTTRANMRIMIKDQVKDQTLSDLLLDTFIDRGAFQISERIRCRENAATVTRSQGDAAVNIPCPADLQRVLSVQCVAHDGSLITLKSVGLHEAPLYASSGTPSKYYRDESGNFHFVPYQDTDYTVRYWAEVTVPEDADTENTMTARYGPIFLFAAISECYDWKEDAEMSQLFASKGLLVIDAVNRRFMSERVGDAPAMRAS